MEEEESAQAKALELALQKRGKMSSSAVTPEGYINITPGESCVGVVWCGVGWCVGVDGFANSSVVAWLAHIPFHLAHIPFHSILLTFHSIPSCSHSIPFHLSCIQITFPHVLRFLGS